MVFKAGPKLCWQCASYKGHRHLRAVPDMLPPPTASSLAGGMPGLAACFWHFESIVRTQTLNFWRLTKKTADSDGGSGDPGVYRWSLGGDQCQRFAGMVTRVSL